MDRMEALVKAHRMRAVAERISRNGLDAETRALLTEVGVIDADADELPTLIVALLRRVARELERDPVTRRLPGGEENPW